MYFGVYIAGFFAGDLHLFCWGMGGVVGGGCVDYLVVGSTPVGVGEEALYFFLYREGEEVSLDGGYAFGGLGGDYVDSYYSAAGFGSFDCYLTPTPRRISQINDCLTFLENSILGIDLEIPIPN